MKSYSKWMIAFYVLLALGVLTVLFAFVSGRYLLMVLLIIQTLLFSILFLSFWKNLQKKGIRAEAEIARVLGRDAKGALMVGQVGLITYNDEYVATWVSDYLKMFVPNLVNHKLTDFLPEIKQLFKSDVDSVVGSYQNQTFEVIHKEGSQVLYVHNITDLENCRRKIRQKNIVVGLLTLDNYTEYLATGREDLIEAINNRIRVPLLEWARKNGILIRRMRSDRFLLVLDSEILENLRKQSFPIMQRIKDISARDDLSITLSAVFVSDQDSFVEMDRLLNELTELVQSRGGDQIAIKTGSSKVEFIGGGSEKTSHNSKVRVRVVQNSIQDLVRDSRKVFILGHVNTDYDAMGAALAMSNWVKALGREACIVLKDVPRDEQLQETLNSYSQALHTRHTFITEEKAADLMDPAKDLLVMVDHSNPAISSGRELLKKDIRKVVIDHHRRSDTPLENVLVSYIESKSSSTCELMTELIEASSTAVPIYEMEGTIMYLGMIVDTNRFKQHTSARTFLAAAKLCAWGANASIAEKALQIDYSDYRKRAHWIEQAKTYKDKYLIDALDEPLSRTEMSVISDSLLAFKGTQAAFTIAINESNGNVAVSARSDGSVNVQKIMEKMNGGGHFSAAALERENTTVAAIEAELRALLDKEENE